MRGLRRKEIELADYERAMQLGLSEDEWALIKSDFGREINEQELLLITALWSEKGCNKLTGNLLRDLRATSTQGTMAGPANLRLLALEGGLSLALVLEQNNSDCFSFPFNGASTGAALAIDRLIAGGFEPLGVSELVRVGDSETANAQRGLHQMIQGVANLLNREQVSLLGTDFYFHQDLNNDAVFNVAAIGMADLSNRPELPSQVEEGAQLVFVGIPGNPSVEIDSATGSPSPVPRMADAFEQYLLAQAFSNAYEQGLIVDAICLGVSGLLPNIFRLADRYKCGFDLAYDKLPFSVQDASLFEVATCGTPHRFLALVEKKNHRKLNDLFRAAGVKSVTIGDTTSEGEINFCAGHFVHAGMPYRPVVDGMVRHGAEMSRTAPMLKPAARKQLATVIDAHGELNDRWVGVLAAPNLCSRSVVNQYSDLGKRFDGVESGGVGASLLPLPSDLDQASPGIACSFKANSLYTLVDPYMGTVHTVAEAVREISSAGGRPLAMGALLNVGDFGNRKTQLALAECARALIDASRMWELPLLDEMANVVLRGDSNATFMTPAVFVVGHVRDLGSSIGSCFKQDGDRVLVIGAEASDLAHGEYGAYWKQPAAKFVPEIDFKYESRLCSLIAILVAQGLVQSACFSASGGLGLAVAKCCFASSAVHGVDLDLQSDNGQSLETLLFGEVPGQAVLSLVPEVESQVEELITEYRVPIVGRGEVVGRNLICRIAGEECSLSAKSAGKIWRGGLSHVFPLRNDTYTVA